LLRSGPGLSLPQESVGDRRCPVRHVPTMSQPRMGRVPAVMGSQGRSSSSRPSSRPVSQGGRRVSAPRARGYRRNVRNGKAPPAVAGGAGSLGRLALPGDGYDAGVKKPVAVPKAPARPQVRPVFATGRGRLPKVAAPWRFLGWALRIRQHVTELWERSHVEVPCLEDDVGLLVFGPAEEEHDPSHVGCLRRSAAHDQVT
jgi:hypothetical protein